MERPWVTFFSQTGKEIADLAVKLDRWPDAVVTNERPEQVRQISKVLQKLGITLLSNRPTPEEYRRVLDQFDNPVVTLHGWLRIVPEEICKEYEIYNGHPGLITDYPELKGKDPQLRAYEGKYEYGGCVIHKVVSEVDEGKILFSTKTRIENLSLESIFRILREISLELWVKFLKNYIFNEKSHNAGWKF